MNERPTEVTTAEGDTLTITESDCPNCDATVPYETGEDGGCHKCQSSSEFFPLTEDTN